jgi:hypothetical protein
LNHPPISLIITAFFTYNLGLGHCAKLTLFLTNDYNLVFLFIIPNNGSGLFQRFLPATLGANIAFLTCIRYTESSALWAKFQFETTNTQPYREQTIIKRYAVSEYFLG